MRFGKYFKYIATGHIDNGRCKLGTYFARRLEAEIFKLKDRSKLGDHFDSYFTEQNKRKQSLL